MERPDDDALIIYADGSCKPKPRRGGYAFLLLTEDEAGEELIHEYNPPGRLGATNNEMELTACVEALRLVTSQHPPVAQNSYRKIVVYADSMLSSTASAPPSSTGQDGIGSRGRASRSSTLTSGKSWSSSRRRLAASNSATSKPIRPTRTTRGSTSWQENRLT
jgi:hypothetical protein